jgi:phosphoribosyl-ATP pyrophosphohydrolase/phosphoribosyl-AMP cyclohydrolase
MVGPDGPACHLGTTSCFTNPVWESDTLKEFSYEGLMELIRGRKTDPREGSYTTYLFEKGVDKILKKIGEECTEVIIAAKSAEQTGDNAETIYEIADLAYHTMVMMIEAGISLEDIHRELASRHVIDKKVKQEKMV